MARGGCKVSAPFGGRREEPDVVSPARQPPEAIPTTRDAPEAAAGTLKPDAATQLVRGSSMTLDRERMGAGVWRVAVPLRRDGALVGAAQVELSLDELARLKRRLRVIDGAI